MLEPENRPEDAGRQIAAWLGPQGELAARLYLRAGAGRWSLSLEHFSDALTHSAWWRFSAATATQQEVESYVCGLHLEDLALARACAEGIEAAWDHFLPTYRGYLRASAGAMLRRSSDSPEAEELADSLHADLYGWEDAKRGRQSLFQHFHGRSKLTTWLRAVLAQKHVDAIRRNKRFESLEEDDNGAWPNAAGMPTTQRSELGDPNRARYLSYLSEALRQAIASLGTQDRVRLFSYYMDEKTLAEIGRAMQEHEATVSRKLDRIRQHLRQKVEVILRTANGPQNGTAARPALDEAQIKLCFEYALEDWPFDLQKLLESIPPPRDLQKERGKGG